MRNVDIDESPGGATGFAFRPPVECEHPYSISDINEGVAAILESGNTLVWFVGEISNFKQHTSGHCYLKLKDGQSQVPAVIWSSAAQRLTVWPEDGMAVTGIASIRVYRKGGYYQLDIHRLQPAGLGALYAAFEALKARLQAEGLFDPSHKKPLPKAVCRVGVVTSKTGAAIRDVVRVISTRSPRTDIVLRNVKVQGDGAEEEIAAAIRSFNRHAATDVLIVGRGGGSIEDMWAFNSETVARAIYESRIPVISAVGHETDFTIADFVADMRAPTPSAAAEMAVADDEESRRYFVALGRRFASGYARLFAEARRRFEALTGRPTLRQPARMLLEARQGLDDSRQRLYRHVGLALRERIARVRAQAERLRALSPLQVLARGYSVVMKHDGAVVRDSGQVAAGEQVSLRFARGAAEAVLERILPNGRADGGPSAEQGPSATPCTDQ